MIFFKRKELLVIITIFVLLFVASYKGYSDAKKRERDIARLLDFGNVTKALETFKRDYDTYPAASDDGKIVACIGEETGYVKNIDGSFKLSKGGKELRTNLVTCDWGKDPLMNELYLEVLPKDPQDDLGVKYIYVSNEDSFQYFGSYELKEMDDYSKDVISLTISCGERLCNFGRSSEDITLEKKL